MPWSAVRIQHGHQYDKKGRPLCTFHLARIGTHWRGDLSWSWLLNDMPWSTVRVHWRWFILSDMPWSAVRIHWHGHQYTIREGALHFVDRITRDAWRVKFERRKPKPKEIKTTARQQWWQRRRRGRQTKWIAYDERTLRFLAGYCAPIQITHDTPFVRYWTLSLLSCTVVVEIIRENNSLLRSISHMISTYWYINILHYIASHHLL